MNHFYKYFFAFFLFIFLYPVPLVNAQPEIQDISQLRFERMDINHGLSQNSIFQTIQDKDGFLWFATQNGLNKYDGYHFKIYKNNKNDQNSLSDNWINNLHIDGSNVLWVGTLNGGLHKYITKTDSFIRYQAESVNGISSNTINDIKSDKSGLLWIATDKGLNRFDPKTGVFKTFNHDPNNKKSISSDIIDAIAIDQDGFILVGTNDAGLSYFDPNTETSMNYMNSPNEPNSISDNTIENITQDSSGNIWIGTSDGLNQFDANTGTFKVFKNEPNNTYSLSDNNVKYIYEDNDKRLWIATSNGLNYLSLTENCFYRYSHESSNIFSLSDNRISTIFQDSSGVLWVGTNASGLNKFSPGKDNFAYYFSKPNDSNSIDNNTVWTIHTDRKDQLWVGTSDGLNVYNSTRQIVKHYKNDPANDTSISSGTVWTIIEESSGEIWVGTSTGLDRFDQQTETFIHYAIKPNNANGESIENVRKLYEDKNGVLWIGTKNSGLFSLDPTRKTFRNFSKDISNGIWVTSIFEDHDGNLWIGTNSGLVQIDPSGNYSIFRHNDKDPNTISHDRIRSIYEDSQGILWIATSGGGLNQFNVTTKVFKMYSEDDGLPNNVVYGILPDQHRNLWLSTDSGISKFNPKEQSFKNFDVSNGLQSNEFNSGSYFKSTHGEMFFGGVNGFNAFFPFEIKDSSFEPEIQFTSFETPNKLINVNHISCCNESISLSYQNNSFSVEFAALDFNSPLKNQYAYMLDGFDKEWIESGSRRFVSYTNLDGGKYTLRIRGTNSDGLWSSKVMTVNVNVAQPIWKMWWMYLFYLIVFLFLIWLYNKIRMRTHQAKLKVQTLEIQRQRLQNEELLRMDRLKDEILANTSHEFRTPLHGMIGICESLMDDVTDKGEQSVQHNLSIIHSSAKRLSHLVDDILDLSVLKHQHIKMDFKPTQLFELTDVVMMSSQSTIKSKKIKLINSIPTDIPLIRADGLRLQQILFNLIGNAIKFTKQGTIEVTALAVDRFVEVSISDTGLGIPVDKLERIFEAFEKVSQSMSTSKDGIGLGLAITKHLVNLHEGELSVHSILDQGSTFTFTIPIADSATSEIEKSASLLPSFTPQTFNETLDMAQLQISKPQLDRMNILVVDDEPVNLQVVINYLDDLYNIFVAEDGESTLNLIKEQEFDMILLDIMLPGISGYEVCRQIREHYTAFELPILLLTAQNSANAMSLGYEVGANEFITKPFSKNELLNRVQAQLHMKKKRKTLLTKQEKIVLTLIYCGFTNTQISGELKIEDRTVTNHVQAIMKKMGTKSRFKAAENAYERNFLDESLLGKFQKSRMDSKLNN